MLEFLVRRPTGSLARSSTERGELRIDMFFAMSSWNKLSINQLGLLTCLSI